MLKSWLCFLRIFALTLGSLCLSTVWMEAYGLSQECEALLRSRSFIFHGETRGDGNFLGSGMTASVIRRNDGKTFKQYDDQNHLENDARASRFLKELLSESETWRVALHNPIEQTLAEVETMEGGTVLQILEDASNHERTSVSSQDLFIMRDVLQEEYNRGLREIDLRLNLLKIKDPNSGIVAINLQTDPSGWHVLLVDVLVDGKDTKLWIKPENVIFFPPGPNVLSSSYLAIIDPH